MFLTEDGMSFFDTHKIVGNSIVYDDKKHADILMESTIFSRAITQEENQMIRDILIQFCSDYYNHLRNNGLNKFVTKMKGGFTLGPIHVKNAEEIINKQYSKIASYRRGCYDLDLFQCNINDARTCKELYELSWDFIKKYNSQLPDVNIRIVPIYKEVKHTTTTEVEGSISAEHKRQRPASHLINPDKLLQSLKDIITGKGATKTNTVGGEISTSRSNADETMVYEFYILIQSDTFKIK